MSAGNLANPAAPRWFGVRRSVWITVIVSVLLLIFLTGWALVAAIGWLFAKAPEATEAGRQAAGVAIEKLGDAVPPEIREQVGIWLPKVAGEEAAGDRGAAAAPATRDVGGVDLGPVGRYPGLSRDHYAAVDGRTEVRYGGTADYAAVLDHYARGFQAAGYRHEVLEATREGELHRFQGDGGRFELRVSSSGAGRVDVEVRHER